MIIIKLLKMKMLTRIIGLFILGTVGALGFAPFYLWPTTVISIGVAYYLLDGRGYKYSFWWGMGYGISNFYWALNALLFPDLWHFYVLGMIGFAFLICGPILGAPFVLTTVTKSSGWRRILYFALALTFVQWLRETFLFTGVMWNPLANITLPIPFLSGIMSVVGPLGLSFILSGCIAAIPEYIKSKSKLQFLFFVPLLILGFVGMHPGAEIENGKTVRIVQPAFSAKAKDNPYLKDYIWKRILKLSAGDFGLMPDLVVWPETTYSSEIDISMKFPKFGAKFVTGAVYKEGNVAYNSLLYIDEQGRLMDRYDKVNLVPFGEYNPFDGLLPFDTGFEHGAGPKIISDFVPAICLDTPYSSIVPRNPERQPKYIINITNDAWLGHSPGTYQHVDMARTRAIETGLPVIFANYIGLSAIIGNRGEVIKILPYGKAGFIDGTIPPYRNTIYRSIGLNRMMLGIVLLSGLILFAFRKKRD